MSTLSFQSGEALSAAKLNELVNMVTGGSASPAGGTTQPLATHLHQQRQFSSILPGARPVYMDKASPYLPPASTDGYYVRITDSLTPLEVGGPVAPDSDIYLVRLTDSRGNVRETTVTASPPPSNLFDPINGQYGTIVDRLGHFIEDSARPGPPSEKTRFVENPLLPPIPFRLFSEAPVTATCTGLYKASLLGCAGDHMQIVKNLESTGGILFQPKDCNILQVIPFFDISQAPSSDGTISAPSSYPWDPPSPCTWRTIASTSIAGQQLDLMARWLTPWKIITKFSTGCTCSPSSAAVLFYTWQAAWGLPGQSTATPPFTVESLELTSLTSPCVLNWYQSTKLFAEAIVEGSGYRDEGSYCTAVRFRAFVRRQVAPCEGDWEVWYSNCVQNMPWQTT